MRLVQFEQSYGTRAVAIVSKDGSALEIVESNGYVRDLVLEAHRRSVQLEEYVRSRLTGDSVSYDEVQGRKPPARYR